ncbi:MAG: radical SAM protein [Defluviitaleaceae bacterium]|nr:radical SAM protein [Defluviitaleaceae bacterium]
MKFPLFIKWSITNECNLRCKHCFLDEYKSSPKINDIKTVIDELAINKIALISFTGGEPFLRDDIFDITEYVVKKGINVHFATNGILLDDFKIEKLKNLGIKNFQISIDGSNNDTHDFIRGKGTFNKTIDNVKNLIKSGMQVILSFTINKLNYNEIDDFVNLGKSIGVSGVRFELFLPIGNGEKVEDSFSIIDNMYTIRKNLLKYSDDKFVTLPIFKSQYGCGAGTINCMINSDLTISPCDLLVSYIRSAKTIIDSSLRDVWLNDYSFLKWNSNSVDDDFCNSCNHSNMCGKGCKASSYAYLGSLKKHDPLCLYRKEETYINQEMREKNVIS